MSFNFLSFRDGKFSASLNQRDIIPGMTTEPNILYYGDNLKVLYEHVKDETVDLVYLDPPFNSNQDYNVLFKEQDGSRAAAQIKAFGDTWRWDMAAAEAFARAVEQGGRVSEALQAFQKFLGNNDMLAYLAMMAPRLVELRRVMKPTASIYLHCDSTASHYLKMLMDAVFGPLNFRNEVIWRRTGSHNARRSFGPIHDTLLFYTKTNDYTFNIVKRPYMRGHVEGRYTKDSSGKYKFTSGGNVLTGAGATGGESGAKWKGFDPSAKHRHWAIPGFLADQMPEGFKDLSVLKKLDALYDAGLIEIIPGTAWPQPVRYLSPKDGQPLQDIWASQPYTEGTVFGTKEIIDADVLWMGPTSPERLGYPTQKPVGLLERIIKASSNEGDTVLDPFCGCGTTIAAAHRLNRRWIGIDITYVAIGLIRQRIKDAWGEAVSKAIKIIGEPESLADAERLAKDDPYQFQWWIQTRVGARPTPDERKKGADKGIDGRIYFHDDPKDDTKTKQVILSVKAGKLHAPYVRDLRGVIEREKAEIGVLIAMDEPTAKMRAEAASAGFYDTPWGKFPRLQILTVKEILEGTPINYPSIHQKIDKTFKAAPKAERLTVPGELPFGRGKGE